MTSGRPVLDAAFLASQRARLLMLRDDLADRIARGQALDLEARSADQAQANEAEDQAQDLTFAENEGLLQRQLGLQRGEIDRALAKLDDGSYGLSDVSGLPIPRERLEIRPQALVGVSEERNATAGGLLPGH